MSYIFTDAERFQKAVTNIRDYRRFCHDYVIVSKLADHLPLYRQAQIYGGQDIDLDRWTLAECVAKSAMELTPVYGHSWQIRSTQPSASWMKHLHLFWPLGALCTKIERFSALARDGKPWGGDTPLGVAFTYAPERSGLHADKVLQSFSGTLQVGGYAGNNRLLIRIARDVTRAYCWTHARRKLHDITQSGAATMAQEGMVQIQTLYRIEKALRGQTADQCHVAWRKCTQSNITASEIRRT